MTLDIRLACLRDAIMENWAYLEVDEVSGTLIVRLKKGVVAIELKKEK